MILFQECPKKIRSINNNEQVKYLTNGQLYISYTSHVEIYAKGFCLENFYHPTTGKLYMSAFLCKTENFSLTLSPSQTPQNEKPCKLEVTFEKLHRWLRFIYTICGLFSLIFLFVSLFFYMTLPELRNFQGNIVCAYILSMSLSTVFLVTIYNIRWAKDNYSCNYWIQVCGKLKVLKWVVPNFV